ncbi:MAG: restriction endonuclease subunit S, partial [Candidatus Poribacteria bacterium]|nr:restriction endonuclease subunit S [Candidatus Poribacteria bacterium]
MNCYLAYKDSQLVWVGEIPHHWRTIKFRYLSQESRRKNDDDVDREMLSLSSYTGVQLKQYEYENTKRTKDESLTYLVVEPNQLVVNPMWQMKRSIGVSYLHGIVSPGYRVYFVDLERLVPQYLHHLMRSDNYVDEYNKHVRGATTYDRSVKKEDFEEIGVLLPPKEEQTQIANFLDHKTAQIDELIRAKERKMELLG